jgi:hypothetical protein
VLERNGVIRRVKQMVIAFDRRAGRASNDGWAVGGRELKCGEHFNIIDGSCLEASRHRGIKASRHRGIEASRHQGIKASRHQGIKASRHQGIKASRHRGIKASRHQGIE